MTAAHPPLLTYIPEHYCAECGAHTDDVGPLDVDDYGEPVCHGCAPSAEDVADRDYDPMEVI